MPRITNRSKYNNRKTKCYHGHIHDSIAEAERCNQLHMLAKKGLIRDLKTQVKFDVIPKFERHGEMSAERAVVYIADFVYMEEDTIVIEDLKSPATKKKDAYILKRKLMKRNYCYPGSGCIFREVIK